MIWLLILGCISAKVIADEDQTFIASWQSGRKDRFIICYVMLSGVFKTLLVYLF